MGLILPIQIVRLAADQSVTSSTTLVTATGFSIPIAANQVMKWEWRGIFTLGATGGFRFQVNVPAGGSSYNAEYQVVDETTPATFNNVQSAAAAFTNASAVASNYKLFATGVVDNGSTSGNVTFQFAQNNSTGNPITLLEGMTIEIKLFS